ncbi:MAG: cation transporter [Acidimicrobiales bacterium]
MSFATTDAHPAARRALHLEFATVALAVGEAGAALASGVLADSVALVAFGADSVIEAISAIVVLAQLRSVIRAGEPDAAAEHRSHRVIAGLFFALAAYVVASATVSLVHGHHPSENALGLATCAASAVLMPGLAFAKRSAAAQLVNGGATSVGRLLSADAAETALCGLLSVSTLLGVGLAAGTGWWWADPVASLVVVLFAIREGVEAWRCEPQ